MLGWGNVGKGGCCFSIGSGMLSSEILWLTCHLHRLWILLSGADLVPRDCIIPGRAARVRSTVQRLHEADAACSAAEAGPPPSCSSFPQDFGKRPHSERLSSGSDALWTSNPSCFLYTWLMQCLPLKSLLEFIPELFCLPFLGVAKQPVCLSHDVLECEKSKARLIDAEPFPFPSSNQSVL